METMGINPRKGKHKGKLLELRGSIFYRQNGEFFDGQSEETASALHSTKLNNRLLNFTKHCNIAILDKNPIFANLPLLVQLLYTCFTNQ